jgi:hypothetical protein
MNIETNETSVESSRSALRYEREMLLSDPERAIGFGALGTSLEIFYRWFSLWRGR